jgi:hypothetical protein
MMLDFLMIAEKSPKRGVVNIYPKFKINKSKDLMIRGGDFYAIWIEDRGLWSTDEQDALMLIDLELDRYYEKNKSRYTEQVHVLHLWDAETGMIDTWHKFCQKQCRDSFHALDEHLIFSNTEPRKEDYASKRLNYALEPCDIPNYERLISVLYDEEERQKIEWAIGAVVTGDSKRLQKFVVLYGSMGTGKSTILNIIQMLFDGYFSVFDAKALGMASNTFALEAFKKNPLVAIQHDGDLSRIEDNTRLNSLVSHELMTVNEKFKSTYENRFNAFLFMGTNKPVKITDSRSGLIRRLIDVAPSGNKLPVSEYNKAVSQIPFELGGIACHCRDVYLANKHVYDDYLPTRMMGASNHFYDYICDSYFTFKKDDGVTLKAAWELYKQYCSDTGVQYPYNRMIFKEELKNYFWEFKERATIDDIRIRNYFSGFRTDRVDGQNDLDENSIDISNNWIHFKEQPSIFDSLCGGCLAQYANDDDKPNYKWENVKTKLKDLDTSRVHYVKPQENHIVIDFDIPDEEGNKSLEKTLEAANKWPETYAELSKSGQGIHLHYIYTGDVEDLKPLYADHIEIKKFTGGSSLRRRLTKCNDLQIATISSGLPTKGDKKMVSFDTIQSEKSLRSLIARNLRKEIHPATKPSIDFIYKILEDAYTSGMSFDISDMRNAILVFALNSTNQAEYCVKLVNKMHFKSEDASAAVDSHSDEIVFYDVEIFPNLFVVCWKKRGNKNKVITMINPTSAEIEALMQYRLIGFNCRRYDNHILYAKLLGYSEEQLYNLSQKIISGSKNCFFGEAYNISYTDIYDFASAGNKKSLKKLEIEMGIHHQELGLPWDQPVPEEQWDLVGKYCCNDVIATEAAFDYLKADWTARQILADIAGMTVNDTTNTLTTRIIFGDNRKPQDEFRYRDLAEPVHDLDVEMYSFLHEHFPEMMAQTHGEVNSLLPYFPGYKYEFGKSTYRDEEVGEGGYVYSEPGMYGNVALLDIASMHPHSALAEYLFGYYTNVFYELVYGRVDIKHEDWEALNDILGGKLVKYIDKVKGGEMTSKDLANALKTAINSVYGLTSASFDNAFHDKRNIDNIVAKRGALFMIDLKHEVQKRGFIVAHIKTDSIKIPDATPEIIQFVMDFGKMYGYSFEHEATYEKMCLVNKSTYIAQYASADKCANMYGYSPGDNAKHGGEWTATGEQFAVPYVFKTLFSRENIVFDDVCETFAVKTSLYLDMNETLGDDEHAYRFVGRIGQFTPIKPGKGGGELMRQGTDKDGNAKYGYASGAKGYRWLESEDIRQLGLEADLVDHDYYLKLVDEALQDISVYGDAEWFRSDDGYSGCEYDEDGVPIYPEEAEFSH